MKRQCIGPKSPSPIRRTSSIILTGEAFLNHEYVEDLQKKYDDNLAKHHKVERSSIGDRLHFVVNIALDEVNAKLAKLQGRENLDPPSSESEGTRVDLSVFFPKFFGSGNSASAK